MSRIEVFESTPNGYRGYEIRGVLGPMVLDPETFCPKRILQLEVDVPMNAHGGRSMSEATICDCESDLVDRILKELRPKVLEYVREVNPFLRGNES